MRKTLAGISGQVEGLIKVGAVQHRNEQRMISSPRTLALVALARAGS